MEFGKQDMLPKIQRKDPAVQAGNGGTGGTQSAGGSIHTFVSRRNQQRVAAAGKRSATTNTAAAVRNEKIAKKPLIYPEFREAAMYAKDKDWEEIMIAASKGEFIHPIAYNKTHLYIKGTNRGERMSKEPSEIAAAFIRFHKTHKGIVTRKDLENEKTREREILDAPVNLSWSKCSKKRKTALLSNYADRCCSREKPSNQNACHGDLVSVLMLAMDEKLLTNETVKMSNNVIVKITKVKRDKGLWWIV